MDAEEVNQQPSKYYQISTVNPSETQAVLLPGLFSVDGIWKNHIWAFETDDVAKFC